MNTPAPKITFNTTSMIDVIFILLVFFIAISRLKEGKLALQLPSARGENRPGTTEKKEQLVLQLDRENRLLVNRVPCVAESDVVGAVRAHKERHGIEAPVLFVADRDSKSGALVSALKTVTDEGYRNIAFSYEPRTGGAP